MEKSETVINPFQQKLNLLKKQILKLDNSDFDLEAWKSSTIIVLERLFGAGNQKIRQIEKLQVDFSSWSLRDASGSLTKLDTCKRRGKEILEICIDELETLGDEVAPSRFPEPLNEALEGALTVTQYKELETLLQKDLSTNELKKQLQPKLDEIGKDKAFTILLNTLVNCK